MNRLATLLAVVAVLAVLGSTVAAVAAYQGRDPGSPATATPSAAPPRAEPTRAEPTRAEPTRAERPSEEPAVVTATPYGVFPDEQVVAGGVADNAIFEVPAAAQGWTVQSADTTIYYGDPGVEGGIVGVAGAAVLDDGYCTQAEGASNRAFVGLTRTAAGDDERTANATLADAWVATIIVDPASGEVAEHTPVVTEDYALPNGVVGVRSDSVIQTLDLPCAPPRVAFTILSLDTGTDIANLVMVRDVGAPGVMSQALAERILQTFQAQVPGS